MRSTVHSYRSIFATFVKSVECSREYFQKNRLDNYAFHDHTSRVFGYSLLARRRLFFSFYKLDDQFDFALYSDVGIFFYVYASYAPDVISISIFEYNWRRHWQVEIIF